jgi:predicted alpha/beta-hydrolase family hydrolase
VRGLAFLGFPLHAAGSPGNARAQHLAKVSVPMLFVQGTRDALADRALLEALVARLGQRATLCFVDDADHSFHVPVRSGRTDTQVRQALLASMARWVDGLR